MKCPYNCINKDFDFNDCLNNPGALPKNNDIGYCYLCGGWWQMINEELKTYIPTTKEQTLVTSQLIASRQRFLNKTL